MKSGAAAERQVARQQASIADHNELRVLMGLPPVKIIVTADAALTTNAKLGKIHGKSATQVLDILYQGEGASPPSGRYIHWWGQFSDELPAPFNLPHGGHGYIEAHDLRHATLLFRGLRDSVLMTKGKKRSTRVKEWAGVTDRGLVWYRWMLGDGRQMSVEFKSRSQLTPSEKRERMPTSIGPPALSLVGSASLNSTTN